MNEHECNVEFWTMLAGVLIRSFWMGVVLLTLWFLMFAIGGNWIYSMHSQWFQITEHDLHVIFYGGMAALKMVLVVLFLVPYVAIKWTMASLKAD